MRTASGVKFYVNGTGEIALLCHPSLGLGRYLFHRVAPLLAHRFKIVTWDPRGVGDHVTRPPTLDGWIDDTLDIIETLKMPVYLLGVSLGTWVMGRVATHAPEFIKGLVLQGATLGFENGQEAVIQRRREFSADGMVAFARKYARTTLVTDNDVLIEGLGRILAETPPEQYIRAMEAIYTVDNREAFSRITVPAVVVVGQMDRRTSPLEADKVAGVIAGAHVALVPQAGHLAVLDQPNYVAEIIERLADGAVIFE